MAIYTLLLGIGSKNRVKFLYYLLLSTVNVFIMNTTKMLYKHDRPMWVNPDVSSSAITKCSSNYGNPSGHSMTASALAFTVLCDVLESVSNYQSRRKQTCLIVIYTVLAFVYSMLMAFSRVVIAIHSWNQIIYGWLLGVWIALFLHIFLKERLGTFVKSEMEGKTKTKGVEHIAWGIIGLVMTILLQLLAWRLAETYSIKTEEEIEERLANIREICPDFDKPIGNLKSFKDIGLAVVFWGGLLGVIC